MVLFETERLIVRQFTAADSDAFYSINGSREVMQYIRPPKTRPESDQFLKENLDLYSTGSLVGRYAVVRRADNEIAGTFSFLYLSGETDMHIGYALLPADWGKGYATELTLAGTDHFSHHSNKKQLFAITDTANIPSQKVLIKAGFKWLHEKEEHGKQIAVYGKQLED